LSPDAAGPAVLGDRLALWRIVFNLADNALNCGHAAHLAIEADARMIILTVDHEGFGISPKSRDFQLEPFVLLERSRN
jgi:C4-dicarboxylate-specific signal transduction histidine kinase